ncbi:MAG: hypothetical protein R3186_08950 [Ruegeria sp.]|nr:hypothetical protein [Ruegeria sp.]
MIALEPVALVSFTLKTVNIVLTPSLSLAQFSCEKADLHVKIPEPHPYLLCRGIHPQNVFHGTSGKSLAEPEPFDLSARQCHRGLVPMLEENLHQTCRI